jgi:hypothetical protein
MTKRKYITPKWLLEALKKKDDLHTYYKGRVVVKEELKKK